MLVVIVARMYCGFNKCQWYLALNLILASYDPYETINICILFYK